ncbi:MAG: EamA family transporter, partial [Proteobacteria bacterium]|nr:EamA family transporter [Pseudomonadota bacterium]
MTDKARPNKTGAAEAAGYRLGLSYMFVAMLFTSIAGIVLRLVEEADGWQVLFYRSSALVVTLVPFIAWRYGARTGRAFLAIGRAGLFAALSLAAAFSMFIFALLETTVANVVFTIGLTPLIAALFAWIALRETLAPATWAAMLVALAGIGLMFGDGLARGTLFVDSRAAALVEWGDVVQGIAAGLFGPDKIRAELGEVVGGRAAGRVQQHHGLGIGLQGFAVERQVEITGPDGLAFTNLLTPRDLNKCKVGQGKYVVITAEDGGIINDPVLLRLGENHFWLALADSDVLLWAKGVAYRSGMDVTIREPDVSPMQIQGPKSKDVVSA